MNESRGNSQLGAVPIIEPYSNMDIGIEYKKRRIETIANNFKK